MRVRFRSSGITCTAVKFVMLNMVMRHDRLHPLALIRIMKIVLHPGRRVVGPATVVIMITMTTPAFPRIEN